MIAHLGSRFALSVALFLPFVVGCKNDESIARKADIERLPHMETVLPERSDLPIRIELSALIEPMEKAELCARVPGMIESFNVDPSKPEVDIGSRVNAGEPLVKLAVPDLEADLKYKKAMREQADSQKEQAIETQKVSEKELVEARAQENRYRAEYNRSKEKHERTTKLVQGNALNPELAEESRNLLEASAAAWQASRAQIDTKQAKLTATATDVKYAQTRIDVARADVQRLEVLISYAMIRAPFDGIVTKRWLDRGAMLKDSSIPILTVVRTDMVRVLLDIPQSDVPLVHLAAEDPNPGHKGSVSLRISALQEYVPGGKFTGQIIKVASSLDSNTRTMRAEVHLDNKNGYLKPGMYGTAMVLLEKRNKVLTVPSTSLVRRGAKVEVFYVSDPVGNPPRGTLKRASVELGLDDGKRVEIRNGLHGAELIVAKGTGVLRQGDKVVAVPMLEP